MPVTLTRITLAAALALPLSAAWAQGAKTAAKPGANTSAVVKAPTGPASSSRALVESGITAYMQEGADAAMAAWLKNSALEGNTEATGQANSLRKVGDFYGKIEGFDILHEHAMSPRTRMVVAVIHYEKGPLFLRVQTYQTKAGAWVATEFNFNTNAIDVMPDTLSFGRSNTR